jgi:gamma-glutamylcyclotransferase (GGCT)/AIG2-like uncharacterized protein YtfP
MKNIFTYGSLMYADIFSAVVQPTGISPHAFTSHPAHLQDWRRHQIIGKPYPAAVPLRGHTIAGVVWLDVPPQAVQYLDAFEAVEYQRETVHVQTEAGASLEAEIYRWKDLEQLLEPDWSCALFEAQHRSSFFKTHTSH